jgi:putative DNA primase/helicase
MVNQNNIPQELKELDQWVNWKKKDKCPVNPITGDNAKNNNPKTWGSYEAAVKYYEAHGGNGIGGIGFVFSKDDPYCGIDGDDCVNKGAVDKRVDVEIKKLDTYSEISTGQDGLHAITKATLPGSGLGSKEGRLLEMYDRDRYFIFTGQWLGQYGGRIESRQDEVTSLYERMAGQTSSGFAFEQIENGVPENYRNDACASYAGHCLSSGLTYEETVTAALTWNKKNRPPMDDAEVVKTVQSIAKKHAGEQFRKKKKLEAAGLSEKLILSCLHSNEDGDANLFKTIHKGGFLFDHGGGAWNEWQGHHYVDDETNATFHALDDAVDAYKGQLALVKKDGKRWKALKARIQKLQGAARKKNVLWCATLGEGLTGREWDQKPWLLPCKNGVVNLKTGKMEPGRQADYLKTACLVSYNPDAKRAAWDQFIYDIFNGKTELIDYVQCLIGYGMTGITREDVLPIFYGHGRNGKTIFFEILKAVLGDLAHKTKTSTLLDSGRTQASGSADADLSAFRGKRLIWAAETNDGSRLNVGKIKELTGSDTLNAREPFARRAVEFRPTHLLCLITNNLPYATASDYALWERVALIPFKMAFVKDPDPKKPTERPVDRGVFKRLMEELPGILNWMVEGCLKWQEQGLNPPEIVKVATEEYQKDNDIIGEFIMTQCTIGPGLEIQAGQLYQRYNLWSQGNGYELLNGTRFGKEMGKRFPKVKRKNRTIYTGLTHAET